GTADGRVYRSDDRAQSWFGFDQGTAIAGVNRLAADPTGKHFLAATTAGVYRYDVSDQIITPVAVTEDPVAVPQTLVAIAASPQQNAALIVPIAGSVRGAGAIFTT